MPAMPYHHGDLRRALLDAALAAVSEHGLDALSMRDVARRAGVSHAAPAHHFRDKAGLLTALAAEGWALLADAQTSATDFQESGVGYVLFVVEHPAHFAVMRAPGLVREEDPDLRAARARSRDQLRAHLPDQAAALAAWSLVHGLGTLLVDGMVEAAPDVETLARAVTGRLRRD
jgi:AcrR family transcriptional regulator